MPGFINLHVHLVDDGCPKDKEFNAKELVRQAKESEEKRNQYKKKCEENAKIAGIDSICGSIIKFIKILPI